MRPALALSVLLIACGVPRTVLTARALVEDPARYDGQAIVLVGTVENPRVRVPPQGSGYTAFTLTDGTARVPVIAWGTQQIGMGDVVEVRGAFRTRLERGERGAPRHRRGEVRASRARRCTAARNSGQPAIGPRREAAN